MPHSEYWPFTGGLDVAGEPSLLQKQLGMMEGEVKEIQMELAAIRKDRMQQRGRRQKPHGPEPEDVLAESEALADGGGPGPQDRDEYLSDVPQSARLREQLIRAKNSVDEERCQRLQCEARLRDLETKLNGICRAAAPPVKESGGEAAEVTALKKTLRDLNEEVEELKMTAADKGEQLEEYRAKYLQAQQQVEELRRQTELMEYDNRQVSDQIQLEIQKMKSQFQAKLGELAPLPELLAGARAQLHEARQLQALAEDGARHLANETRLVNDKLVVAVNSLNQERADKTRLLDENQTLKVTVDQQRAEIEELSRSVDELKCQALRLEEKLGQQEVRLQERGAESARLAHELEEAQAAGARALARARSRADCARRSLHAHVAELERQLALSRAHGRAAQRDRDETRQRVQSQINSLQENFELVEIRLRALQNQVTSLKHSYSVILTDDDDHVHTDKLETP